MSGKKKGEEEENRKDTMVAADRGVKIELGQIDIYGMKLGPVKFEFKNEQVQKQTIVNKKLERETLDLLQGVCHDAEVIYDDGSKKKEEKKDDK